MEGVTNISPPTTVKPPGTFVPGQLMEQKPVKPGFAARTAVLIGLTLGAALDIMVATLPNVALTNMAGYIHASVDEAAWINMAYFMAKLTFLLLAIKLTEILGSKKLIIASLAFFTLGCLVCSFTSNYSWFILGRVLQGAGGAAFYATAQAVLFTLFPISRQGTVQAIFSLAVVLGPNALPAYSGWLTYHDSWQLTFLTCGFLGVFIFPLIHRLTPQIIPQKKNTLFGWTDILILIAGICCMQYVMEEGPRYDWFEEPKIVWLLATSIILLIAFFIKNFYSGKSKLIDFSVLKVPSFAFGFLISFISGFALFGSGMLVPRFVQMVLRYNPSEVGYTLFPSSITILIGLVISAVVIDTKKINPFACVATGVLLVITSMILVSDVTLISGFPDLNGPMLIRGLGLGLLFVPVTFIAFSKLKGDQLVNGTALFNFGRQFGGTIAMAFLPTYLERQMAYHRNNLTGYLDAGNSLLQERLLSITNGLRFRGYTPTEADEAALNILDITVNAQSAVLAFDAAFLAIALVFICAAPVIITVRINLHNSHQQ